MGLVGVLMLIDFNLQFKSAAVQALSCVAPGQSKASAERRPFWATFACHGYRVDDRASPLRYVSRKRFSGPTASCKHGLSCLDLTTACLQPSYNPQNLLRQRLLSWLPHCRQKRLQGSWYRLHGVDFHFTLRRIRLRRRR